MLNTQKATHRNGTTDFKNYISSKTVPQNYRTTAYVSNGARVQKHEKQFLFAPTTWDQLCHAGPIKRDSKRFSQQMIFP